MADLHGTDCGCTSGSGSLVREIYRHLEMSGAPLAMGYVPDQRWSETYSLQRGLHVGTLFPELHKPFCGKGGRKR